MQSETTEAERRYDEAIDARRKASLALEDAARAYAKEQREATAAHLRVAEIANENGTGEDFRTALARRTVADGRELAARNILAAHALVFDTTAAAVDKARDAYTTAAGVKA